MSSGELLFAALATPTATTTVRRRAEPARNVRYTAKVAARASKVEFQALLRHTDRVAEVHNTLRVGTPVSLDHAEVISL